MATYSKEKYVDENGLIITASKGRILDRRKRIAELYKEMLPRYASFKVLYADIAEIIAQEFGYCTDSTVLHDLQLMGLNRNTPQSRMTNNIRKEGV